MDSDSDDSTRSIESNRVCGAVRCEKKERKKDDVRARKPKTTTTTKTKTKTKKTTTRVPINADEHDVEHTTLELYAFVVSIIYIWVNSQ